MEKVRYMIGDAANRIQVEAHVLRYWEEELDLEVPRNELGHRYYTEENLKQFEEIKRLKEEGFQLKAIKMLIHNYPLGQDDSWGRTEHLCTEAEHDVSGDRDAKKVGNDESVAMVTESETKSQAGVTVENLLAEHIADDKTRAQLEQTADLPTVEAQPAPPTKLEQFQMMMNEIVRDAIAENNHALGQEIGTQVGERVLKEMNYLMRDREEQEEERFRKLDETIRSHQRRPRRMKASRKKEKARKIGLRTGESVS